MIRRAGSTEHGRVRLPGIGVEHQKIQKDETKYEEGTDVWWKRAQVTSNITPPDPVVELIWAVS